MGVSYKGSSETGVLRLKITRIVARDATRNVWRHWSVD